MDTLEIIERLKKAIKASEVSNCCSISVEDNLKELLEHFENGIEKKYNS